MTDGGGYAVAASAKGFFFHSITRRAACQYNAVKYVFYRVMGGWLKPQTQPEFLPIYKGSLFVN